MNRFHRKFLLLSVQVALAAALCSASATARVDEVIWKQMFRVTVPQRDLELILPSLKLNSQDAAAVQALLDEYTSHLAALTTELQQRVRDRGRTETHVWQGINYDWWDGRFKLAEEVEANVSGVLSNEGQRTAWKRGVAAVRRSNALAEAASQHYMRHVPDLIAVLESVPLTDAERTDSAGIALEYEEQMDSRLRAYLGDQAALTRLMHENANSNPQSANGGNPVKWKKYEEAMERWEGLAKRIRDMETEYSQRMADTLGPSRQSFLDAIDQADYPQAFKPCPAELAADAIRFAPDVSDVNRAAVQAIFEEYKPVRDELSRQIAATVRRWESGDHALKREMMALWERCERGELARESYYPAYEELAAKHPVNAMLRRRHDVAIDAVKQIRAVFSDDEFAQLPTAARICMMGK